MTEKKLFWLWHGGSSYAAPDRDDLEAFESISEAVAEFRDRLSEPYYPCVEAVPPEDGGPEAWVFFGDPPQDNDPDWYPDEIWSFGPRGGFHRERV